NYSHLVSFQLPEDKIVSIKTSSSKAETMVQKNHLLMLSNKFRKALNGTMKEALSDKIELMTNRYDLNSVQIFLEFMKSGKLALTGDTVIQLLSLANEHNIEILEQKCLAFIKDNLDLTQLLALLQTGIDHNLIEL